MTMFLRRIFFTVLAAFVVIASIAGCAQIRQLTYPADFTYLEKKEVETLMQKMRTGIGRLDQLVTEASTSDVAQQQNIINELSSLERIATRLSGGHKQTNQIVINDHIEQFISDIGTAKMFASTVPPNYNKTRNISNSCQQCHQFR